jgi:hypothetical protein
MTLSCLLGASKGLAGGASGLLEPLLVVVTVSAIVVPDAAAVVLS